jgi:hypothetical protein
MKQKRKNGMLHAVFSFLGFNHTTSQSAHPTDPSA